MGSSILTQPEPITAFHPLSYQLDWRQAQKRFMIELWARQTGKSTRLALEVSDDALDHGTTWVLLSAGERQSRELGEKVRTFIDAAEVACEVLDLPFERTGDRQLEIRFRAIGDGKPSRIIMLPANPDTARGFSANVALDEFAFHRDSDAIWTALYPTITRGYKLRITSTPNGTQNRFYHLWELAGKDANWARQKVTIYDARDAGLPVDIEMLHAGIADEYAWRQEYLCEFVDEATSWMPWELIRAAEHADATAVLPETMAEKGPIFIGWDVARWHDLSVIWIWQRVGDVLWTRGVIEMRRVPLPDQQLEFERVMRLPGVVRACIDAGGMGEGPADYARMRFGDLKAEPVKFTAAVKAVLATDIRRAAEDKRLRIPSDERIREDWHGVRQQRTVAGNVRFDGEAKDSHCDRFWAAALGVHAASDGTQPAISIW